jgi:hypothetical protein
MAVRIDCTSAPDSRVPCCIQGQSVFYPLVKPARISLQNLVNRYFGSAKIRQQACIFCHFLQITEKNFADSENFLSVFLPDKHSLRFMHVSRLRLSTHARRSALFHAAFHAPPRIRSAFRIAFDTSHRIWPNHKFR